MALKVTQGLLCTGYYPSLALTSPTFRKKLTQTWCRLVQNHRLSKLCDQRATSSTKPTTATLLSPLPSSPLTTLSASSSASLSTLSSSSLPSRPRTRPRPGVSSSPSPTIVTRSKTTCPMTSPSPTSLPSTNPCSVYQIDDHQFRSMFEQWNINPSGNVSVSNGCPFSSGSKSLPTVQSQRLNSSSGISCNSSSKLSNFNNLNVVNNTSGNNFSSSSIKINHHHNIKNIDISDGKSVKSFGDIPTPKSYPIVGTTLTLLAFGGASHLHEYCDSRHQELGPIYREKLGPTDCVFIADSSMVQKVYSNEGRFPNHLVPEAWTIYNEITGIKRGLFFMDGPEWEKRRKGLNKVFLCQPVISDYTEAFNQVVTDVIAKWSSLIKDDDINENSPSKQQFKYPRSGRLTQLERELYNWSIESLGTMIFGRRLGCVETSDELKCKTHRMEKVHLFVQCVQQLFVESAKMTLLPARLAQRFNLPVWQRFMAAAGQALNLARGYVEENVAATRDDPENGSRGVLEMLLAQPRIDQEELIRIIVDLFLAAVDLFQFSSSFSLRSYFFRHHMQLNGLFIFFQKIMNTRRKY